MKRKVTETKDGSNTLYVPELDEYYHSIHGAIQEAEHVFIEMGLMLFSDRDKVDVLEMGFGTGLNAFLTYLNRDKISINYTGVEKYPVGLNEALEMKYATEYVSKKQENAFSLLHETQWDIFFNIDNRFRLRKMESDFYDIDFKHEFDLVYFDAFGPRVQPDLWEKKMFENMYRALRKNGVLVTYCAKGQVRRDMVACGFKVERLPGPPGKREMLRATK